MRRVRGRSFKITKNQAKGYGYAKARSMKANPGVTTIAAINGRGSYARKNSARSVMGKLKQNARVGVARKRLSAAQKSAFAKRMAMARNAKRSGFAANRSTSRAQSATSRKNIKKAQAARRSWGQKLTRGKRVRVGAAHYGTKAQATRLKPGVYVANKRREVKIGGLSYSDYKRSRAIESHFHRHDEDYQVPGGRKTRGPKRKKAGSKMARRRKRASGLKRKARRSSKRRARKTTKTRATKRRRRRRSAKSVAKRRSSGAKRKLRNRKRRTARAAKRKTTAKRRRRKTSKKATSRKRRSGRRKGTARRRKGRKGSARRRKGTKAKSAPRRRRRRKSSASKAAAAPRRRRSRKGYNRKPQTVRLLTANKRRRRHRRNGRRGFKMNGVSGMLKTGAVLFGGFALHRLLTNVLSNQVLSRLLPAPAAPAVSGFSLQENRGLIASVLVGGLGSFLASKVIKNQETKKLVIGGMVASTLHGVVLSVLKSLSPTSADMLAGPEDGTAARLAAMYGLGAGASIMPRYAPIGRGMGEYFREPMNGLGEYFREPMNGLGEYISATSGLGSYENNGDLYQAAAGFGSHDYNGNHVDPSGDLERQLDIAEAAAGVGAVSPFEAAAGIGPMQAAAGFGAISTVPSADTWIPGSADGQLWAGVKAITNGQSATETTPAGVLQTDGGQGIFG